MDEATDKPFGQAMTELLIENDYVNRLGNPTWHAFADHLDMNYEVLRKAVAGEREPSVRLMEECARELRIRPEYFAEYRMAKAQEQFDISRVGFDTAMKNLAAWAEAQPAPRPARRRRKASS